MFELYIDKQDFEDREKNKKLVLVKNSPLIEEFLIDERPYSQLSDHLGLSIELEYKGFSEEVKEVKHLNTSRAHINHEESKDNGFNFSDKKINILEDEDKDLSINDENKIEIRLENFNSGVTNFTKVKETDNANNNTKLQSFANIELDFR